MVTKELADIRTASDVAGRSVTIAGVVLSMRVQNTASGRMGIVTLADDTAKHEVVVYREVFDRHRHKLREDELLVLEVKGRQRYRSQDADGDSGQDNSLRLEAVNIYDLNEARNFYARGLRITCDSQSSGAQLKAMLTPHLNGSCPIVVDYMSHGARCAVKLGEQWRVNLNDDLIQSLGEWLQPENVQVIYSA
jgi:DNA polymerase-3 subunit alpha